MYLTEWAHLLLATKGRSPGSKLSCSIDTQHFEERGWPYVGQPTHTAPWKGESIRAETFLHLLPPTLSAVSRLMPAPPAGNHLSLFLLDVAWPAFSWHASGGTGSAPATRQGLRLANKVPVLLPSKSVGAQAHPGLQSTSVGKSSVG